MNQTFKKRFRFTLLYILLPLAVANLIWSVANFFLYKSGGNSLKDVQNYSYHYRFNLANKIVGDKAKVVKVPIREDDGEELKGIRLKGTYLGGDASFVVIEDGSESKFVYIGDRFRGYRLDRVGERKVLFKKGGKSYYVLLDDKKSSPSRSSSHFNTNNNISNQDSQTNGGSINLSRDEMKSYIKNPDKIWSNIRIQEIRKNGELGGFRVNYVKRGSFFEKAGLRSGDIIKAIDGNEIRSLGDVMKYYTNADNLDTLTLTVLRNGSEMDLDFSVN